MQEIKNYINKFKNFEKQLNGQSKSSFHAVRKKAIDTFLEKGFPTTREEEWRFTNVAPIVKTDFSLAEPNEVSIDEIKPFLFENWDGPVAVLVNGRFSEKLSMLEGITKEVKVMPLSVVLAESPDTVVKKINKLAVEGDSFAELNTAFATDGLFIDVPDNVSQEKPIHIMHVFAGGNRQMSHPRNLILAGKNAYVSVTESYHTLGAIESLTNSVSEVFIDANGNMEHYRIQDENLDAFHMGQLHIHQQQDSRLFSINFTFGGKIVRNTINSALDGSGIESILNGLYMGHGDQLIDNHTFIDHRKPHCESHELYRGILKDKARGVFSGKIMVHQDAQKTDAKQSNNCLLLSDDARINTKPQLEIYADDVKCTHGATVGQLDDEAVFYLRSRGVPQKKAVSILTYAFAEEIIEGIRNDAVKKRVNELLEKRLQEDLDFIKE